LAAFDWLTFLQSHRVAFVDSGPNISRGHIGVQCPFCGAADPSQHMSINLGHGGWQCWRHNQHRGRKPARLIQALLNCSWGEALRLAGERAAPNLDDDSNFGDKIRALVGAAQPEEKPVHKLTFMPEMHKITEAGAGARFLRYIEQRGYSRSEALDLCDTYGLRYATRGPFKDRVIVPIFMEDGLANWTARAISKTSTLRYKTLSADRETAEKAGTPVAPVPVEQTLFNYDVLADDAWVQARAKQTLVLVEGPFDALRLDYMALLHGLPMRATCTFGKRVAGEQVALLGAVAGRFKRRVILLDPDATVDMIGLSSRLAHISFEFVQVPEGAGDPAEMTIEMIKALFA